MENPYIHQVDTDIREVQLFPVAEEVGESEIADGGDMLGGNPLIIRD